MEILDFVYSTILMRSKLFILAALWLLLWPCHSGFADRPVTASADIDAVVPGTQVVLIKEDPQADGWDAEVFAAGAFYQLEALANLLVQPASITVESLTELCAQDISMPPLRPERLVEVYRDDTFIVERLEADVLLDHKKGFDRRDGFARALHHLMEPLDKAHDIRAKFKIFQVDTARALPATRAYVQLSGRKDDVAVQINATWHVTWSVTEPPEIPESPAGPLIQAILVIAHEQSTVHTTAPLFADCTEAVLGKNRAFDEQLRPGVDHWMGRIDMRYGLEMGGRQGLAVGDVNGDYLEDLYVCQMGGLPNLLFIQNPDGTVSDQSADAGVDWLQSTHGALFVDLDNDGDQDLLVGVLDGILVQENDGNGRFKVKSANPLPAAIPYSLAATDYDQDGDVDVYVCCYNRRPGINRHFLLPRPVPYHDANNGGRNVLLRNDGNWRFRHVTKHVGLDVNNRRFSFAAAWEDYDNDGDPDLYVANDFGRNNLYRNEGSTFRDVAAEQDVEDIGAGMSTSWGDYNNDGLMDLYVSNMFSSAGTRISVQEKFHADVLDAERSELQRHARGNTLFKNLGGGMFADVSVEAGVVIGRWAWGSRFVDLNSDGWEDLLVTNGFITQEDTGDL